MSLPMLWTTMAFPAVICKLFALLLKMNALVTICHPIAFSVCSYCRLCPLIYYSVIFVVPRIGFAAVCVPAAPLDQVRLGYSWPTV